MKLECTVEIEVTDEDVKDILITACEGGIGYWCPKVEKFGDSFADDIYEHFVKGGALRFWEDEDETGEDLFPHDVTIMYFKNAMRQFIEESGLGCVYNSCIDTGCIDSCDADVIVQYMVFGEVVYG